MSDALNVEILDVLDEGALDRVRALRNSAVEAVTNRFYSTYGDLYMRFGEKGKQACREDLAFHLEFLHPVLQFGLLTPMVEYLRWLNHVLVSREIPSNHLAVSLDWLGEFFAENIPNADAEVVVSALMAAKKEFLSDANALPLSTRPVWPETSALVEALLSGNQAVAHGLVTSRQSAGFDLIEIDMHMIQPAMYEIGELWAANKVSVAQEHMASTIIQSIMLLTLQQYQPAHPVHKKVLLACVEGNHHAIGLQMVSHAFLLAGWDVQYLGADVPNSAMIEQIKSWQPDLVGLSASFPQQVAAAKKVIHCLNEEMGESRPSVIIGGLVFNRFRSLASSIGSDGFAADAADAVEVADGVVRGSHRR